MATRGNGNGRGRPTRGGKFRGGRGRGYRGGGRGGLPGFSLAPEDLDFTVQMYADVPPARGNVPPRGGRGRGGRGRGGQFSGPNSGSSTPSRGRGRGFDSPRGGSGRGRDGLGASPRGRGGKAPSHPNVTLSALFYQERPFLRPIVFVPSVLTKILFQGDEELLKPGVEDVDDTEQSHVPTADQVSRVFGVDNTPHAGSDDDEDEEQEEIEEVDFSDVGKLFEATTSKTTTTIQKSKLSETTTITEHQFTGFYAATKQENDVHDIDGLAKMVEDSLSTADDLENAIVTKDTFPKSQELIGDGTFFVDTRPSPVSEELAPPANRLPSALQADDDDDIIVYVAPHPRNASGKDAEESTIEDKPMTDTTDTSRFSPYVRAAPLPAPAPQPLASTSTADAPLPISKVPDFASVSFSFSQSAPARSGANTPSRLRVPPVSTPRQAKAWNRKRGSLATDKKGKKGKGRGKSRAKSSFGAFGAMREEALLYEKGDPRLAERRRGDSDLEWGDTDDDVDAEDGEDEPVGPDLARVLGMLDKGKGKAKANSNASHDWEKDLHGMDVDPELAPDLSAMKSFVGGLLGADAGRHMTIDDVMDEEVIRMEDEEDRISVEERGSSDSEDEDEDEEIEDVLAVEEAMLISESLEFENEEGLEDDDDDDDDDSDDDEDGDEDLTPRTSFQARLERLRARARSRRPEDASFDADMDSSDEDVVDDFLARNMTWAEKDDDYIQQMHDILDENEDILSGRDRVQKKKLFNAIRDGEFDDIEGSSPARRRKDKGKGLPLDLQAQWEKDRKHKADLKRSRQLAKLEAAADPLARKKGGKKGRKAMLATAKLDPTIVVLPNRIIDMVTLVQQIRRFVEDVGGPRTMSLPPTNKETRKNVHEMALAFNLKSLSKGKGDARYTTLTKTTKSGFRIDEAKVSKIVRRSGGMGSRGDSFVYDAKKGRGGGTNMPRHKEGDEVGKAAPKLNETNLGFRMLALMGWSEGDRIGASTKGLEVPLTAIMKTTKLGLGATK